jgi:hypothetical protein
MSRVRHLLRRATPERCVELLVFANVAFLGLDIALAHAANHFERAAEWAPIAFSAVATVLLLPTALRARGAIYRVLEVVVALGAIVLGVVGMILHLRSAFFEEQTLANLVYSAPFVAPLAYVAVGLLLLLVRIERSGSPEVGWWLLVLALGGFVGNLGMSLLDHAQNAFFRWSEWIPVVVAAFATGFLFVAWLHPEATVVRATYAVLAVAAATGVLGFVLHLAADWRRPSTRLSDRFLFGAPIFAPLLFTNLAVLGALALWATQRARRMEMRGVRQNQPTTPPDPAPTQGMTRSRDSDAGGAGSTAE